MTCSKISRGIWVVEKSSETRGTSLEENDLIPPYVRSLLAQGVSSDPKTGEKVAVSGVALSSWLSKAPAHHATLCS